MKKCYCPNKIHIEINFSRVIHTWLQSIQLKYIPYVLEISDRKLSAAKCTNTFIKNINILYSLYVTKIIITKLQTKRQKQFLVRLLSSKVDR